MAKQRTDPGGRRKMRGDEPTLVAPPTTHLYRAVNATELGGIEASSHRRFPVPDGGGPFVALRSDERARAEAKTNGGWVTRFAVRTDHFAEHRTADGDYRIDATQMDRLADAIVGPIVVIRTTAKSSKSSRPSG